MIMELTMRLLVSPVLLFAALLLLPPATQALDGIPSLMSLRGLGSNGRQPLSREGELMKALQFLEEYDRNLDDSLVNEDTYDDWQPQAFPFLERNDVDEDIVPDDVWEDEQEDTILEGNRGEFKNFLLNLLQGANTNRNDVVFNGYNTNPQRSSFNNNQYVLFSPVEEDLEDEIALEVAIEKLKAKQKEEKLWEDIIGDMVAEELLEADAREDINKLIDVEEEEAMLDEDSIFEEEDPWAGIESSDVVPEDSDVVPWSWGSQVDEEEEEDESSLAVFDTESLTSEEEDEVEREAAILLLEEILADEEEKQREEEEQEEILEMVLGEESVPEEEELVDDEYDSSTEEALENYFKALLENSAEDQESMEETSDDLEESVEDSDDTWGDLSSVSEEVAEEVAGEIIQDYGVPDNSEEDEIDYATLLQEITNEIEAAAEEVEEEVLSALTDRLDENDIRYLNEDDNEEVEETNASNELDDLDPSLILNLLQNYQLPVQQEKRKESATCPIRSLVHDCAFIDSFPEVDIDGRYRNIFQKACNRHELCYTCGQRYDIESKLCDEVFDAEMLAECGQDADCIDVADQFLFLATETHIRASKPSAKCQAKCLLPFLIKD